MTAQELQNKLDNLKKENKEKEFELRKEIAKQKRKERADFVKAVGEFMIKRFPEFTTIEQFEKAFEQTEEDTFFKNWAEQQIEDIEQSVTTSQM